MQKCFAGLDVFTGEKRETHSYEYYSISVPFVEFKEYLVSVPEKIEEMRGFGYSKMREPIEYVSPLSQVIGELNFVIYRQS